MGDDYYHVEPPPQTAPVTTPTTPALDASAMDPPAPSTPIEAAAEEAAAMIAAAAARTDSDVSCGELLDDADKDEKEPHQPKAGGRTSRGRATTSATAQWAGASAQGGSDVHLDSDFATDALIDGDYQSGRNRRGCIATTAARPPLPPRRLGTGRRARSAASLAYAEVTCSSSSSSSSEDEKGCDDQEDLCTAAAPHRGRAVQNVHAFLSPFVFSLYMLSLRLLLRFCHRLALHLSL